MKILVITTSVIEMRGLLNSFDSPDMQGDSIKIIRIGDTEISFLLSDPGIFSLTYVLTRQVQGASYDLVVNAGICGSYKKIYKPGTVIRVEQDMFADIGAMEKDGFADLFDMGLIDPDSPPFRKKILGDNPGPCLRSVKKLAGVFALTVNQVPLDEKIEKKIKTEFDPDIETMEGAAFFYVCSREELNFVQLRVVSNYCGERDKSKWEIQDSMKNLGEKLKEIIYELRKA